MPDFQKVKWDSDRKREFLGWFHQHLSNTIGDRAALERKWKGALTQWRAARPQGSKDFPYPGASDEEVPVTAIHSDPIIADFLQSLHAPEDYWTPVAKRQSRVQHASPLREALTAVDKTYLKLRRVNERAMLDMVVLGTSIYKVHWLRESKKVKDYNEDGTIGDVVKTRSHPVVDHVPLQHFYIPADAWDIDPDEQGGARWVAQRFQLNSGALRLRAESESPMMPAYDKEAVKLILGEDEDGISEDVDVVDQKIRALDEFMPWKDAKITLYEVWVRYDVDGDGIDEDVVVIWHHESMSILRATYNPFMHGRRPFYATKYLPNFGFYGIGLAEIDEWAQATVTRLLNAQIDNVLLANTRMWAVPQGSGIMPGEPMYPNKILTYAPGEQPPRELRTADIYPSLPNTITQIMQIGEMRTAVSELRQGNITGLPARTPATTVLSILREGNKRFDMILSNFRDVHSEIGLRVMQLLAQFVRDDEERWFLWFAETLGEEEAALVMEVLMGSIREIETSFGIGVTATSAQVNKEMEKQSFVGLIQIVSQIYTQLVQTSQMLMQVPPGTPVYETAAAAYTAGVELISRLLERFDIQNPSQYLGNLQAIAGTLEAQSQGINPAMGMLGGTGGGGGQSLFGQQGALGPMPAAGALLPPGALAGGLGFGQ